MNIDTVQDSTRVVVSGLRHGSILPGSRAEMWRDVYLNSGADLRGSVWGNRLSVQGPNVSIQDAVYVRGEIVVEPSNDMETGQNGSVTFGGCVTTPDSLVIQKAPFRTRILGSVYSGVVNLSNTIVYGNVYARNALLRNTVVLGGVFCRNSLLLEDSIVSTFRSRQVQIQKGVTLLFPVAISEAPAIFSSPMQALPFFDLSDPEGKAGGAVAMDARDMYPVQVRSDDGKASQIHLLSLDERVLEASTIMENFRRNQRFLEGLSLGTHLVPEYRAEFVERRSKLEDRLFSLLDVPIAQVQGRSAVDDLLKSPDIVDTLRSIGADPVAFANAAG